MKRERLLHEFKVDQFGHVYETLLDFKLFGKYHPVIVSVELINDSHDSREYEIREKVFLFGFIPMQPVYRATVSEPLKGKSIMYTSAVKKNISLEIVFTFEEKDHLLEVKEDISIKANNFIGGIFMKLLRKMHLKTIENIKKGSVKA